MQRQIRTESKNILSYLLCINDSKHVQTSIGKVLIKLLQGGAVTQTVLGGLTVIYPPVANLLKYMRVKVMKVSWQ